MILERNKSVNNFYFVFGAMRSGTTLLRLMLDSHRELFNPGEVDFLFDFISPDQRHPSGWSYDVDAMQKHRIFKSRKITLPDGCDGLDLLHDMIDQLRSRSKGILTLSVHRNAELIAELFPQARIIHFLRDPRDVARSSIGMGWAGTSYHGINHWIGTEGGWRKASNKFAPDQILTIKFEDLMSDLETHLRQVCEFLTVPFSMDMLDYYKSTTYGPPDPKIAEQWRRKASNREIALLEGKCGDLLVASGYQLHGQSVIPSAIESVMLRVKNKVLRWKFNIRKFGLMLFLSSHFARLIGLESMKDKMRIRMDEIVIKGLK